MTPADTTIAVIGGTGKEGSGLSLRWAHAGYDVIIGSRQLEKALRVATELNEILGQPRIRGMENYAAAEAGDIVVLSVPYSAHRLTLETIKPALFGKILIDVTAPINPKDPGRVQRIGAGSAAVEGQEFLGQAVTVVAAFQNISAGQLMKLNHPIDSDVLVCGDNANAKETVIELARKAGMRGLDAGPLVNAIAVEGLTAVLIAINKRYKTRHAGIRITNLPES